MIFWKDRTLTFAQKNLHLLVGLLILTAAIIIRYVFIDFNPVGLDEPYSIYQAQQNLSDIIKNMKGGNNPPLYEIILHFWIKLFGIGSIAVRVPSLLFAIATLVVIYDFCRQFFGFGVAIIATMLTTFSSLHVYFSQEARVYSLFMLLVVLSFYILAFVLKSKNWGTKHLISLFLVYLSLIYSHYLGFYILFIQMVFMLIVKLGCKNLKLKYFFVLLATAVCYLPYIKEFLSRFIHSASTGTWLKPAENLGNLHDYIFALANSSKWVYLLIIGILWFGIWAAFYKSTLNQYLKSVILFAIIPILFLTSFSIFFNIPLFWKFTSKSLYIVVFIAFTLIGTGFVLIKKNNKFFTLIVLWSVFSLILFFVLSFFVPMFISRYLVFTLPAFYILFAVILSYLFKGNAYYAVSTVLVVAMILTVSIKRTDNIGLVEITNKVKELKKDNTKVVIHPNQFKLNFLYHYDKQLFKVSRNLVHQINEQGIYPIYRYSEFKYHLRDIDSNLLFIDANSRFLYPELNILDSLKKNYLIKDRFELKENHIVYQLVKK